MIHDSAHGPPEGGRGGRGDLTGLGIRPSKEGLYMDVKEAVELLKSE